MMYGSGSIKRILTIHLDYDEDVLASLEEVVKNEGIKNGAMLSGIGTLSRCRYHAVTTTSLPPHDGFYVREGPIELVSADGVIAGGVLHLHFMATDYQERAFGGHLELGCRTLYLCEFVVAEFTGPEMSFEVRRDTGLRLLSIEGGETAPGPAVEFDTAGKPVSAGRAADWPHKPGRS